RSQRHRIIVFGNYSAHDRGIHSGRLVSGRHTPGTDRALDGTGFRDARSPDWHVARRRDAGWSDDSFSGDRIPLQIRYRHRAVSGLSQRLVAFWAAAGHNVGNSIFGRQGRRDSDCRESDFSISRRLALRIDFAQIERLMVMKRREFLKVLGGAGLSIPTWISSSGCGISTPLSDPKTGLCLGYVTGDVTDRSALVWLRAEPSSRVSIDFAED